MQRRRDDPAIRVALRALDAEISKGTDALEAADVVCARLGDHFARWIGVDGWRTVFKRALGEAAAIDPDLHLTLDADLRLRAALEFGRVRGLEGDSFVPLLASVIEVLGRLLGKELAIHLVELGLPEQSDV